MKLKGIIISVSGFLFLQISIWLGFYLEHEIVEYMQSALIFSIIVNMVVGVVSIVAGIAIAVNDNSK